MGLLLFAPKDSIPTVKYMKTHLKCITLLRNCLKLTESLQIQEFPKFHNKYHNLNNLQQNHTNFINLEHIDLAKDQINTQISIESVQNPTEKG